MLIDERRVAVDGVVVSDPERAVVPEQARITIDGQARHAAPWTLLAMNKPRGVVTTRRDPDGRPTVFDLLGDEGTSLVAVGRLDLATSGLLLLTTDTRLADWLADPSNAVPRTYVVTVRGDVSDEEARQLETGVSDGRPRGRGAVAELLAARSVTVRKRSRRESHLTIELAEGKNREIRRMMEALGHEVTRLKRVAFGGVSLGDLAPGTWRPVPLDEAARAFPRAPLTSAARRRLAGAR